MRPAITSVQRGSEHQTRAGTSEPAFEEPLPVPVFVDHSGLRGRLLRGFGWPVSVIGAILAVAMGSSLIGVQADAPAMGIPVQPARPAVPPPTASPPSAVISAPSSPRAVARSATAGPGTASASKAPAIPSKTAAAPSKAAATAPKPGATAQRGAKLSGRPSKQP
ncbi:hypothetical protein [Streptomyces roseus]|uniref:Uncharacterized protein n=1 Tax=Streptomyces roseus TaxID=66430 RepID=A0A0J6XTZ2_9ACTN|nr:hypothetical protein [Streptomyces roseus]KMO98844.1 hypothetical protein ACS04_05040 [Streptomyces roseus]